MQINNSILSLHLLSPLRQGAGCIFRRPPSVCRSRSSAWHEMNKQHQQKNPTTFFFPFQKQSWFLFPHGRSLLSVISPLSRYTRLPRRCFSTCQLLLSCDTCRIWPLKCLVFCARLLFRSDTLHFYWLGPPLPRSFPIL